MQPDHVVDTYERELELRLHGVMPSSPEFIELGREVSERVGKRRSLGLAPLRERFAPVFSGWADRHPDDLDGQGLLEAFCRHPAYRLWVEFPGQRAGLCLEEAFSRFAESLPWVDRAELTHCRYSSLIKALAIDPNPAFVLPPELRRRPGLDLIVDSDNGRLYASVKGRVIIGPVTHLAVALLQGVSPATVAAGAGLQREQLRPLELRLAKLGLLAMAA